MKTILAVSVDFPRPDYDEQWNAKQTKEEATSMLSTLCRHSDRWDTLEIHSFRLLEPELDWRKMLPGSLEKLKRLSLFEDIKPIMETMKHWQPQIRELHVQTTKEQLQTLSQAPWLFNIRDLTLKCNHYITFQMTELLHACRSLRYLHIDVGTWALKKNGKVITLDSLTELIFNSQFPLSSLHMPSITCITLGDRVLLLEDLSYPCLKRLSITSCYPNYLYKHLRVPLLDYLFLDYLEDRYNVNQPEIPMARIVIIHRAQFPEAWWISMLRASSGVLEELELVDVRIGNDFIGLFTRKDQCVRTVREFRFRNRQYQRWVWTPSTGWEFLGMWKPVTILLLSTLYVPRR